MSEINYQALRLAAENATPGEWCADDYHRVIADAGLNANYYIASCSGPDNRSNKRFIAAANPATVLALLDENESMCRDLIARNGEIEGLRKLVAELEEAKSKLNEQRVYYEGVIADGSKRIAELEKQCAEWERKALSNFEECAAMAERIEEMQTKSAPDSFGIIGENIRTQDNRITSDPMFCVYQKREIVVDADYDHDRIVWVDEDGNEANKRHSRRLELLHENFREPPEKWRRVAVKDIDEFVTCCFTEQGCKDYLAVNGHNLRLPFIYVNSGFRNAEYIGIRNWLAGIRIKGE
ncbi:TPA: ead/Ea22-like family protein [Escherichia coli]|nr:ead/Ea22-like family protein [Escherichia coli]